MFKKKRNMFESPDLGADFQELSRIDSMSREETEASLRLLDLEVNEELPPRFQRLLAMHKSADNAKPAAVAVSIRTFWPTLLGVPIVLWLGLSIFGWEVTGLSFVLSLIAGSLSMFATASVFHLLNKTNSSPIMSMSLVVVSIGALITVVFLGTMSIRRVPHSPSINEMHIANERSVPGVPTITGYTWNSTPISDQPFNGTITGSNFVTGGTSVFFCVNDSSTCYQHPAAGVNANSSTSLTASNVNLSAGSWQLYVESTARRPVRSRGLTSQIPPPISGDTWNRTAIAHQYFNASMSGLNFLTDRISVFICVNSYTTCYKQPMAGLNVTSSTSLNLSNVSLRQGSWQIYVRTSAGQSARSTTFAVR